VFDTEAPMGGAWAAPAGAPQDESSFDAPGPTSTPPPPGHAQPLQGAQSPEYRPGADAYARFKPGIITLRPLNFGQILDGGIKGVRHNPKVMFGINALIALAATVVLYGLGSSYFLDALSFDTSSTANPFDAGSIVGLLAGSLVSSLVLTMVTALSSVSVGKSVIGVVVSPREAWTATLKRMPAVLGVTALMGGAVLAAYGIIVGIIILAATASPGLAVFLGIILVLGGAVAMVWLSTKLSLTLPAAVLERVGPIKAMKRSWALTTGRFWMIFSILLVATVITSTIQQVLTGPLAFILPLASFNSSGPPDALVLVLFGVATYLGLLLSTVFLASVTAIIYTDQRMRREGFDLVLSQATQRR